MSIFEMAAAASASDAAGNTKEMLKVLLRIEKKLDRLLTPKE